MATMPALHPRTTLRRVAAAVEVTASSAAAAALCALLALPLAAQAGPVTSLGGGSQAYARATALGPIPNAGPVDVVQSPSDLFVGMPRTTSALAQAEAVGYSPSLIGFNSASVISSSRATWASESGGTVDLRVGRTTTGGYDNTRFPSGAEAFVAIGFNWQPLWSYTFTANSDASLETVSTYISTSTGLHVSFNQTLQIGEWVRRQSDGHTLNYMAHQQVGNHFDNLYALVAGETYTISLEVIGWPEFLDENYRRVSGSDLATDQMSWQILPTGNATVAEPPALALVLGSCVLMGLAGRRRAQRSSDRHAAPTS